MKKAAKAGLHRLRTHVATRDRDELRLLLGAVALVAATLGLVALVGNVLGGDTQEFDERILKSLRKVEDPAVPIGPNWLSLAAFDITALGGPTVLGLAVAAVLGYLVLYGLFRNALFVLFASAGGWILNEILKQIFARPRPTVVPHLREVMSLSFPSGHALTSAVVFLTLGALLMRVAERPLVKWYCIGVAMLATALVGASRVYLGVHYPTDVLGGWLIGLSWALLCWLVERSIEQRYGLEKERVEAQG
ncbi:MAG: phosphatase PAP2 family protein [Acidobacteria bacterium]|nr:phosphatase PAP2 family protein [Acidobacteriota bacterium]